MYGLLSVVFTLVDAMQEEHNDKRIWSHIALFQKFADINIRF